MEFNKLIIFLNTSAVTSNDLYFETNELQFKLMNHY